VAIRVRKLARELGRSSGEVLGLLHHLGFRRYTKPDDMVNDQIAGKARKAVRQGVRAPAIEVEERRSAPPPAVKPAGGGLMAQLVPGVVPTGAASRPAAAPPRPVPAAEPAAAPERPAEAEGGASEELQAALARADALHDEAQALRRELDEARAELERLRAAQEASPDGVDLMALLRERGLVGSDEHDRALEALGGARKLASALSGARLSVAGGERLRAALGSLLLLDGPPPDELGAPAVAVGPERAEGPGHDTLSRHTGKLGEQLLLNGFRRVRVVGVGPRWHAAVRERLDRRIELDFRPGGTRDAAQARADAEGVDMVLYVKVPLDDEVREALTVAVAQGDGLAEVFEAALEQLAP
jgi:hypothetical protein